MDKIKDNAFYQIFAITLFFISASLYSYEISSEVAQNVSQRIWKNECNGTIEGLTHWNTGENFGSFGIGHFIWYPEGVHEGFHETFPDLLLFIKNQGIELPSWLQNAKGCPWKSRDEFYKDFLSAKMISFRQLLFDTKAIQARFIAHRLEMALPEMIKNLSNTQKTHVNHVFGLLSNTPRGLYAMIDYSNFKGLGTSASETYKGKGWGLLQVLSKTSLESDAVVENFTFCAKKILEERVQNSPPERHEDRWLKGWQNRINTYLDTQ